MCGKVLLSIALLRSTRLYKVFGTYAVILLKVVSKALEHVDELGADGLALLLWVFQPLRSGENT